MTDSISSDDYLIHFTSFKTGYKKFYDRENEGFANLLSIIENGFKFSSGKTYTSKQPDKSLGIQMRVGMICFAEIRLKDIADNKGKFGNFGICMKKEWVEKYSGQPVLYSFASSVNNKIMVRMGDLVDETYQLYLELKDERIKKITTEIAGISNLFQAVTEIIKYKCEKERRIIDDPNNELLEKDIQYLPIMETKENTEIYYSLKYLPISKGGDAKFFIIPKKFKELFCDGVINCEDNKEKIRFIEDI
jgi:hypothetical protein